jgi:hypothetical protein
MHHAVSTWKPWRLLAGSNKLLCDDEVKECLLGSESEEILSYSEFHSENELDDCALLDVVVDDNSDEDDIIQDFVWEDTNNYKGQRKHFTGSVGPQGTAKEVTEIVDVFELFFNSKPVNTIVEVTNRYAEQFLRGLKLSSRSTARAWKPMTEGEIYVVLGLFMLMDIIEKPTLRSYFTTRIWTYYNKRQIRTNL